MYKRKNSISYFIYILLAILLTSCDPARVMIIKTSRKPNVSVKIYANRNILPRKYINTPGKLVIKMPAPEDSSKRDTLFYYGMGNWRDTTLMMEFSKNIDSIVVVNSDSKIVLNDTNKINMYLLEHRHGFALRKLTIEAK